MQGVLHFKGNVNVQLVFEIFTDLTLSCFDLIVAYFNEKSDQEKYVPVSGSDDMTGMHGEKIFLQVSFFSLCKSI